MPKIIKNGTEYSGVPVEVVTAWAPTADPVQVKEPLMGNADISSIGDGTVTGAIASLIDSSAPLFLRKTCTATINVAANSYTLVSKSDLGMTTPSGYSTLGIRSFFTGNENALIYSVHPGSTSSVLRVRNLTNSALSNVSVSVDVVYVKTGYITEIS